MKTNKLGLLAVEGLEDPVPAAPASEAFAPDKTDEHLMRADVVNAEYAHDHRAHEELGEAASTLCGIHQELSTKALSDGLSEPVAQALNAAIEHLVARSRISARVNMSLEGYGGRMARCESTKVALESISGFIKVAIEKLLSWLKGVMVYLLDGMEELMQGADRVAERAREVMNKAREIAHKSIRPDGTQLDSPYLTRYFTHAGALIAPDDLVKTYDGYTKLMGADFSTFLKEMTSQINDAAVDAAKGDTKDETLDKSNHLLSTLKARAFAHFTEDSKAASHEVLSYSLPFGQQTILATLSKEADKYVGLKVQLDRTKVAPKVVNAEKLGTLNYDQIMAVGQAVEKEMLFGLYKDYQKTKTELQRIEKAVTRNCGNITRKQQNTASGDNSVVTYSVNFLKEIVSATIAMTTIVHRYDIILSKALLEYCTQSIKMHA